MTGIPTFRYSENVMPTPCRRACSITIRFAIEPTTVRFPASVLTAEMISAICSLPAECRKNRPEQQHRGNVAHQVGKNRDDHAERDRVGEPLDADPFDRIMIDAGRLRGRQPPRTTRRTSAASSNRPSLNTR